MNCNAFFRGKRKLWKFIVRTEPKSVWTNAGNRFNTRKPSRPLFSEWSPRCLFCWAYFFVFQVLDKLRPKHLKVFGTMSTVRNSIGANGYVADEIITARSGVRVTVAFGFTLKNIRLLRSSFISESCSCVARKLVGFSQAQVWEVVC